MELKVKKLHPDAQLPTKTYKSDACFDLYSVEDVNISNPTPVSTGISMEIPQGYAGFIWDRSGLSSKGIHRLAGVIDAGFLGELKVILVNTNHSSFTPVMNYHFNPTYQVKKCDRIAQIFITKVEDFQVVEVDELSETDRGEKGWGSSGK